MRMCDANCFGSSDHPSTFGIIRQQGKPHFKQKLRVQILRSVLFRSFTGNGLSTDTWQGCWFRLHQQPRVILLWWQCNMESVFLLGNHMRCCTHCAAIMLVRSTFSITGLQDSNPGTSKSFTLASSSHFRNWHISEHHSPDPNSSTSLSFIGPPWYAKLLLLASESLSW